MTADLDELEAVHGRMRRIRGPPSPDPGLRWAVGVVYLLVVWCLTGTVPHQ